MRPFTSLKIFIAALAFTTGSIGTAQAGLGEKFDIRAFHDELLSAGAIPLDTLEAKMNTWIEKSVDG